MDLDERSGTAGPLAPAVAERIEQWWPGGRVPADGVVPPAVAWTRSLVADAAPASVGKAQQALSHIGRFTAWAAGSGVDAGSSADELRSALFTDELLDAYWSAEDGLGGRPQGSATASMSFLRRVAAGSGALAETRESQVPQDAAWDAHVAALRLDAAGEARPATGADRDPHLGALGGPWPDVPADVVATLERWEPTALGAARSARVAPFARAAAASCGPVTARRALADSRAVAYLAAWVDAAGRPVRSDIVFDPGTISEFSTVLADRLGPASAGTYRSTLARIAKAVVPGIDVSDLPCFARVPVRAACSDGEVTAALAWADRRRRVATRRWARAMVLLAVGAGIDGSGSPWVRPGDIMSIEAGVGVELWRPDADGELVLKRMAFVLPAYVPALRAVAEDAVEAGDEWLLGPGKRDARIKSIRRHDSGGPDLGRLRSRWIVDVVAGRHLDLFSLMSAAGISTLTTIEDLFAEVAGSGRLTAPRRTSAADGEVDEAVAS